RSGRHSPPYQADPVSPASRLPLLFLPCLAVRFFRLRSRSPHSPARARPNSDSGGNPEDEWPILSFSSEPAPHPTTGWPTCFCWLPIPPWGGSPNQKDRHSHTAIAARHSAAALLRKRRQARSPAQAFLSPAAYPALSPAALFVLLPAMPEPG